MKHIYIYLFRDNYTDNHINYMYAMLSCMEAARELFELVENERTDLNALEIETKASPWAVEFMKHMSDCDMLYMTCEPIICD